VRRTHTALPIFAWEYKTAHHVVYLPFFFMGCAGIGCREEGVVTYGEAGDLVMVIALE